jgi:uncharacterized protein YaaQ
VKLIVAVVQSDDASGLLSQLTERGFRATRVKTAGGFLREPNATVFLGVEDHQVEATLQVIRENCITRRQQVSPVPAVVEPGEMLLPFPLEVEVGGATVFVLDVARTEQF